MARRMRTAAARISTPFPARLAVQVLAPIAACLAAGQAAADPLVCGGHLPQHAAAEQGGLDGRPARPRRRRVRAVLPGAGGRTARFAPSTAALAIHLTATPPAWCGTMRAG